MNTTNQVFVVCRNQSLIDEGTFDEVEGPFNEKELSDWKEATANRHPSINFESTFFIAQGSQLSKEQTTTMLLQNHRPGPGFYTLKRNAAFVLELAAGREFSDVIKEYGITEANARAIIAKEKAKLPNLIRYINKMKNKKYKDKLIEELFCCQKKMRVKEYFAKYGWMHSLYVKGFLLGEIGKEKIQKLLITHQNKELGKINNEMIENARSFLWQAGSDSAPLSTGSDYAQLCSDVKLVCYSLNPEVFSGLFVDGEVTINDLISHKRVFFNPIEIDLSNYKYVNKLEALVKISEGESGTPSEMHG